MTERTAWAKPAGERDWADRQLARQAMSGFVVTGWVLGDDGGFIPVVAPESWVKRHPQ